MADKKNKNSARGLMQITNEARKTLGNEKGEIKDHYITVTREDLNTPNLNVCVGIRWLFQKQKLTSNYLGRDATWEETIQNFKGLRGKSDRVRCTVGICADIHADQGISCVGANLSRIR